MSWVKRFCVLLVLILILVGLLFGGCGKKTNVTEDSTYSGEVYPENGLPKDKKVTLSAIFPVQGFGKGHFAYAVQTFEKRFPNVKINVRYIEGGTSFYQLMQSLIKSGSDEDMYDWVYNFGANTPLLIQQKKLEPQNEMWERTLYDRPDLKVKDAVLADELEVFQPDGNMYVIPQAGTIFGVYFNKKMFRENGWNMQPKNWDEYLALCEKIKSKKVYPLVGTGKFPFYFKFGWGAIPYEVGGDKFRKAEYSLKHNVYKDPAYLMMFKRLEEFARRGYLHPGTVSFDHTQSQMEFLQGKAAMIPVGAWIANEMREVVSEDFEWGFMAFPGNDPGQPQVVLTSADGSCGYIWEKRPNLNKRWAKEFNLWMLNLDIQQKMGEEGAVPARMDFVENKELVATLSPSALVAMEYINKFNVKTLNPEIRERTISNSEMAKFRKVEGDNIVEVISLKKKAEQAVKDINDLYMRALKLDEKR